MGFVNERSEILGKSRTIDYERDAILQGGGVENLGYYRMPDEHPFNIKWKNEKIEFITVPQIKLLEPDGSKGIITYLVTKCYYPENLREYKSDIIKLVIDGLETYGYNYGRTEGTEVIVKILPTLGNLQLEPLVKLPADNSPIKN